MSDALQAPPASAIDTLVPGALPPEDLDPLAEGILMAHQAAWLADSARLKLAEKGRRTGITFAEALDDTLIAAAKRSAGGDNVWYIGDTKEKGLEFINVCARFARTVARELLEVEEFLFEDRLPDGASKYINAYRIRFASGFQIAALSSRPAAIRGLQGVVVVDEAAFHPNVRATIDACNALLIWGGRIRVISTHNGALNAFAELVNETRVGKTNYSLHRVTFDDAVANGLYERVCLINGWVPTPEGKAKWYAEVRGAYGTRGEAMREELDAVPREGEGTLLPLAWIEACSNPEFAVLRWEPPADDFVDWPENARRGEMLTWLDEQVRPQLDGFPRDLPTAVGGDFAMRQDRSSYPIGYTDRDLARRVPLILELRQCPYDQQKQALFYVCDRLARFQGAVLDANGNGMVLAQEARQRYGEGRVLELMANDAWYRENTPKFRAAFEDRMIQIPADLDTRDDLRQFRVINGVGKIPRDVRTEGTDGGRRHGDNGIGLLNFYAATLMEVVDYGYDAAPRRRDRYDEGPAGDDDDEGGTFARHRRDEPAGLARLRGAW